MAFFRDRARAERRSRNARKGIMHLGKKVRLERIFNRETNRAIVVPMDHGVSVGPLDGIIDMRETVSDMAEGGADAVLMHKGLVRWRTPHRGA